MFFFIIIVVLLLILVIPIPLKFVVFFSQDKYYIKFYNINIISTDDGLVRKYLKSKEKKGKDSSNKKATKSKDKSKKFSKDKFKNITKSIDVKASIKNIYRNLNRNKFKIHLTFNNEINYSLGDAARTAIFYGVLYSFNPILFFIFSIIFKIKKFKNEYKPIFKDELLFELRLNCIITFSLVQIIYMLFIILKSIKKNQEVNPQN